MRWEQVSISDNVVIKYALAVCIVGVSAVCGWPLPVQRTHVCTSAGE